MGQRLSANPQSKSGRASKDVLVSDKDRAMLDLKRARDKLRKFRNKLEKDGENLTMRARELVQSNKNEKALFVLKMRKFKLKGAENVEAQLARVLTMIETIDWQEQSTVVLKALESGTQALNKMHEEMPLDLVESILEDNEEAVERQESISELLKSSLDEADNAELESELAALEKDMVDAPPINLPAAPSAAPVAKTDSLPAAPITKVKLDDSKMVPAPVGAFS